MAGIVEEVMRSGGEAPGRPIDKRPLWFIEGEAALGK
jgi:hypothetical protein